MLLFHGTSQANAVNIQNTGLLPRKGQGNWDKKHLTPSVEGFVYLTGVQIECQFHAMRTALRDNSLPSIVTVELRDEANLYPDENFYHFGHEIGNVA
jgi:hypothetical protein